MRIGWSDYDSDIKIISFLQIQSIDNFFGFIVRVRTSQGDQDAICAAGPFLGYGFLIQKFIAEQDIACSQQFQTFNITDIFQRIGMNILIKYYVGMVAGQMRRVVNKENTMTILLQLFLITYVKMIPIKNDPCPFAKAFFYKRECFGKVIG